MTGHSNWGREHEAPIVNLSVSIISIDTLLKPMLVYRPHRVVKPAVIHRCVTQTTAGYSRPINVDMVHKYIDSILRLRTKHLDGQFSLLSETR